MVDPYQPYKTKNREAVTIEQSMGLFREAYERTNRYIERRRFLVMSAVQAAFLIPDESLDFVYIDGIHSHAEVMSDLCCFFPKIRNGGLIAGHDWNKYGVKKAVREFTSGTKPEISWNNYTKIWWFVK
jgi:hypothetical protein